MITRIVSGGQTGADRAALDFAIAHKILHGGWCPKGRLAEDGPIDRRYRLKETDMADYAERTERNVIDSDGTVIFTIAAEAKGGSAQTAEFAIKHGKPWLHLHPQLATPAIALRNFIDDHGIQVLNVAGSRASQEPDVSTFAQQTLGEALGLRDIKNVIEQ